MAIIEAGYSILQKLKPGITLSPCVGCVYSVGHNAAIDLTGHISQVAPSLTLQWDHEQLILLLSNYSQDTHEYCCQQGFLFWLVPLEEQGMQQELTSESGTTAEAGSAPAGNCHPLCVLTPPKDTPEQLGAVSAQVHGVMGPHAVLLSFPCPQYKTDMNELQ